MYRYFDYVESNRIIVHSIKVVYIFTQSFIPRQRIERIELYTRGWKIDFLRFNVLDFCLCFTLMQLGLVKEFHRLSLIQINKFECQTHLLFFFVQFDTDLIIIYNLLGYWIWFRMNKIKERERIKSLFGLALIRSHD